MAAAAPLNYSSLPQAESALTCAICITNFDSGFRRPLILPSCGHTFCRICIKDLAARGDITCPSCRHKYEDTDPDSLPINFNIQCLAGSSNTFTKASKAAAEDPGSQCPDHNTRLVFWCQGCELAACGECLFEKHPRPEHSVCRISDVIAQVKQRAQTLAKESSEDVVVRLGDAVSRTFRSVSDLQEAAHLLQETARVCRTAQAASDLPAITSVFEAAKSIRQRVEDLKGDEGATTSAGGKFELSWRATVSTRPAVVALSDGGGLAQVKVEEKGIHVYSLRAVSTAYSVAIKLNILVSCLAKESPMAFLDIKAGERRLGRVYITLNGAMRRAQQFMALCLGTLGPSYRGTKFDGMSERGQPGEYVRGGDYQGRAGLGGESLMDRLEWGGPWSRPKAAGQVCGVGGDEERRFGALFAICLQDNPEDTFKCPFGSVVHGLEVLQVACRHEPFSAVNVSDCGVVIPF